MYTIIYSDNFVYKHVCRSGGLRLRLLIQHSADKYIINRIAKVFKFNPYSYEFILRVYFSNVMEIILQKCEIYCFHEDLKSLTF